LECFRVCPEATHRFDGQEMKLSAFAGRGMLVAGTAADSNRNRVFHLS
jgi:hypothetical protein